MKRFFTYIAILLALALVLTACGGEEAEEPVSETQPAEAPTEAPATEPTTVPAEDARLVPRIDSLWMNFRGEPDTRRKLEDALQRIRQASDTPLPPP